MASLTRRNFLPATLVAGFLTSLCVAIPAAAQVPFACTGEAFIVQNINAELSQVDQSVSPFDFIGVGGPAGTEYNNMGFRRTDGLLYAVELNPTGNTQILQIDSTGAVFGLGRPAGLPTGPRFDAGDVTPDGTTMYITTVNQDLYALDLTSVPTLPAVTAVSVTGSTGFVFDWAVNPTNGLLYGGDSTAGQLAVLDPGTGVRTDFAVGGCSPVTTDCSATSLPSGTAFGGAWFNAAGRLFLYQNGGFIFEIDLAGPTIVSTQVGPGSSRNDGAACVQDVIGAAKSMSATNDGIPETVTIDYVFENISLTEDLFNITSIDDLTGVFGTHGTDWTFTSISSIPAAFANPTYDGHTDTELVNQLPTQDLLAGSTVMITVVLEILNFDNLNADGEFCNQVLVVGETLAGNTIGDLSTDGIDPDPNGDNSPDERELSCIPFVQTPGIQLIKSGTQDPTVVGSPTITEAGDAIDYTFQVTNTGDVTLTDVDVTDPMVAPITCPPGNPIPSLLVGSTETCSGTYTITQADIDAGQKDNTATATGNDPGGNPVSDQDTHSEPIVQVPALDLVKSAAPTTYDTVGQIISYSYLVTNTGNVVIDNLTVADDNDDEPPGVTCPVTTLAPGASTTCTAQRTVTQADLDAGSITNVAIASGTDPGANPVSSPPDSETVTSVASNPAIQLVKTGALDVGGNGASNPGDVINYTFDVTNTGDVVLTDVTVSDPMVPVITCPSGNPMPSLAVGVTETCTGVYTITQADIDAGQKDNTATATGNDPGGNPVSDTDSHSEPIPAAVPQEAPCTGEAFIVQDVNAQLTQVDQSVSPFAFIDIGPPAGIEYNNLGFRRTDGLLYAVELNPGGNTQIVQIDRNGTVFGLGRPAGLPTGPRFDGGDVSTDGTTMYITTVNQDLYLLDLTSVPTLPPVSVVNITGDTGFVFDWAYNPVNGLLYGGDSTSGQLAILDPATGVRTDVNLVDTGLGTLPSGTAFGGAWFNAAGRAFLYRNNGEIYEIDLAVPTIVDIQTGPGSSRNDGASCVQDVLGAAKQMAITTDGLPETVTIDYVFDDLSVVDDIFNLSALDDLTVSFGTHGVDWTFTSISSVPAAFANPSFDGHLDIELINQVPTQDLLAGASATVTVTLEVLTLAALNVDSEFCNQILLTGETLDGTLFGDFSTDGTVSDPDGDGSPDERDLSCVGLVPPADSMSFVKSLQGNADEDGSGDVSAGDILTYSFVATNTGASTLTNVTIADPLPGLSALNCTPLQPATLAPAATLSCTATYTVTSADVAAGSINNTATASSDQTPDVPDSETVTVPQPAMNLVKSLQGNADEDASGDVTENDTLTYSFVVTNTGTATLTNVSISDPLPGLSALACTPAQPATLAPAATLSCTATYVVTAADVTAGSVDNTATASSDQTPNAQDSETVPTAGAPPGGPVPIPCTGEAFIVQDLDAQLTQIDQSVSPFVFLNVGGPTGIEINNLGFRSTDGLLYAVELTTTGNAGLIQIDANGDVFNLGSPAGLPTNLRFDAGDVSSDGNTMYLNRSGTGTLYRVDLNTLAVTSVAITGATGVVFDWAYNPTDGFLYGGDLTDGQLAILDPTSGVRTDVNLVDTGNGILPGGTAFGGAWFDATGRLFLYQNTGLIFEIDLSVPTIVATQTGPGSTRNDGAACIQDAIGSAKQMSITNTGLPETVTIDYVFENFSAVNDLSILSGVDDLSAVFGTQGVDWTFISISSVPAAFANPSFDGAADTELINQAPTQALAPLTIATVTVQIQVLNFDNLDNGQFCNQVVVTAESASGVFVGDLSTAGTDPDPNGDGSPDERELACLDLVQTPAIQLVKTGALDLGGDGVSTVGDVIDYTFQVTNTGNVTLTSVTVTDPMVSPITCPSGQPIPSLAPGASETCTGTYSITQADIDAGQKDNTATATGNDPGGNPVSDQDTHSEPIPAPPLEASMSLVKTLQSNADEDASGDVSENDTLTYSFVATNTGAVTLTGVTITDPLPGLSALACTPAQPATLAPAATLSCTATYMVTAADVAAGSIVNTATASSNETPDVQDSENVPVAGGPVPLPCTGEAFIVQNLDAQLTQIDQSVSPFVFIDIGGPTGIEINNLAFRRTDGLLYGVELNPSGTNQIVQIDANGDVFGLGLPAGLPTTLRYDGGDISNDGNTFYLNRSGSGFLYRVDLNTFTFTFVAISGSAGTVFDWAVNPTDGLLYGGDLTNGQLAILDPATGVRTDVNLVDTGLGTLPTGTSYGGAWFNSVGRLFLYRNNGTIYEIDLSVPTIVDIQTGPGSTRNDAAACVQDAIGAAKQMSITTDGLPETVTIDYVFENFSALGNLSDISGIDDLTAVFGTQGVDWTFTSISSVPASFANPAFDGDADTELVNQAPTQNLAPLALATISVQIEVLNFDNLVGGQFCNQIVVTALASDGSTVGDLSTAGTDPDPDGDGSPDERDLACVTPPATPDMALVKSLQSNADEDGSGSVTENDTLTYSFVLTNTGNVTLTNVTISDPLPGLSALSCTPAQPASLAPGATLSCTATYVVTAADATAGVIDNTATASSDQAPDVQDSESVPVVATDGLALVKTGVLDVGGALPPGSIGLVKTGSLDLGGDGVSTVGDVITYTLDVTNTGPSILSDVTVSDPLLGAITCPSGNPIPTLGIGVTETCTGTYAITQADIDAGVRDNTATASGTDEGGNPVSAQDSHSEPIPPPGAFACTGEAFIVQNINADLTMIDQTVSPFVFVPVVTATGIEMNNLGFRITDGLMYAVELNAGGNVQVVQIDALGNVTGLGRPAGLPSGPRFDAGDVSPDGNTMYITSVNQDLYVLDLTSVPTLPPVTVVPRSGASGFVFDWTVSPIDGRLYGGDSTNGQLAILDPVTGVRTDVNLVDTGLGTLPAGTAFGGAWFNNLGELFLYRNNGEIYTIDLSVPTITNIQTGPGSSRNDGAACVEPLPAAPLSAPATKNHLPGVADPGDLITYTFQVTNNGAVTLTNVLVSDPMVPVITCPSGNPIPSLAPAASETCTGTYAITQADIDAGFKLNTAIADSDQTGPVPDSHTEPIPQTPALDLVKTGALDLGGDGVATVGDLINYTFQVTNTGNVTLTTVAVTDPMVAAITCPGGNPIPSLAPEASVTCTGTYAITQADIDAGQKLNTATATGNDPGGNPVSDTDSHTEPIPGGPGGPVPIPCTGEAFIVQDISAQLTQIDQSVSPFVFLAIGGPTGIEINNLGFRSSDGLLYGLQLTTTGNNGIVQIDANGDVFNLGSPPGLPTNLRLDAGDVSRTGNTMYLNQSGAGNLYLVDLNAFTTTSVTVTGGAGLVFDWAFNPADGLLYGGDSTDGQLAILDPITGVRTDVNLVDTGQGVLPSGTAFGGAWFDATGRLFLYRNSGAIFEIDLSVPTIVSSQTGPGSTRNDGAACIQDAIGSAKLMTIGGGGAVPATVTIDYVFENFSDLNDLSILSGIDELSPIFGTFGVDWTFISISSVPASFANPSFNGATDTELINQAPTQALAPLSIATVTVQIQVLNFDNLDNGQFCNQVVVTAQSSDGVFVGDLSTAGTDPDPDGDGSPDERELACLDLAQTPGIQLVKNGTLDLGPDGVANPGDLINYTFDVTNIGNVTLSAVAVTDPMVSPVDCGGVTIPPQIATLAPGATVSCTGSYAITQADIDAGQKDNTATATGNDPGGNPVSDQDIDSEPIPSVAAIRLIKDGALDLGGNGAADPGDPINYTFMVTNTGNVILTNVVISDPMVSPIVCPSGQPIPSLAPGVTESCTGTYLITQADIDAGQKTNTATATGNDPGGNPVSDQDTHVEPIGLPPLAPFPCTGEAFIVQNINAQLSQIDQATEPFTFINIGPPAGVEYNNLGFRSTDGLLYAVELNPTGNTQIVQIDSAGAVTGLGRPAGLPTGPRFDGGDISSDGSTMYITSNGQDLYLLDLTTVPVLPAVTSVPVTGSSGFVFDWTFNPFDGLLYGGDSSDGELAILDPATGVRTDVPVPGLPTGTAFGGAWFDASGSLFLFRNNGEIFEIDLAGPTIVDTQEGPGSTRNDAASCVQNLIGGAKLMTTSGGGLPETVTIDYVFENFSPTENLFNLSAIDNLSAVFGVQGVDWTFTSISSVPAAFANPAFDGATDPELIQQVPTQSLLVGATASISVTIEVLTTNAVNDDGQFCNQALITAENSLGVAFGDQSTAGTDPDPNGDGSPDERELACLVLGQSTFACNGEAFIVQNINAQLTFVDQSVDPFVFVPIGAPAGTELNNLGLRSTDGLMYAVELSSSGNVQIVQIDAGGNVVGLGRPAGNSLPTRPRFDAGDISTDGSTMFITSNNQDLYLLDLTQVPTLPAVTSVNVTGATGFVFDWAFNPANGLLYGGDSSSGQLAILDPATGVRTDLNLAGLPAGVAFGGAWFGTNGNLFLYRNSGTIFEVDLAGPTIVGSQGGPGSTRNDAAACTTP